MAIRKLNIELKWAIIFNIALLCWVLLENTLAWYEEGIENSWWLSLLFGPFAVLMYLLALRQKRRTYYGEDMVWIQGFRTGVILSLFISLLSPLTNFVIHEFFTKEYFNTLLEFSVTHNFLTHTKINHFLGVNFYLWQAALSLFGLGVVISAIAAFFVRKKN